MRISTSPLLDRLAGVGLDFQDAAGDLGPDRRLLNGFDQRFGRKGQIDGMRLDRDDRQGFTRRLPRSTRKKG